MAPACRPVRERSVFRNTSNNPVMSPGWLPVAHTCDRSICIWLLEFWRLSTVCWRRLVIRLKLFASSLISDAASVLSLRVMLPAARAWWRFIWRAGTSSVRRS